MCDTCGASPIHHITTIFPPQHDVTPRHLAHFNRRSTLFHSHTHNKHKQTHTHTHTHNTQTQHNTQHTKQTSSTDQNASLALLIALGRPCLATLAGERQIA
jgi:hypothetical protein